MASCAENRLDEFLQKVLHVVIIGEEHFNGYIDMHFQFQQEMVDIYKYVRLKERPEKSP